MLQKNNTSTEILDYFNKTVKNFAFIKVFQYAQNEMEKNYELMGKSLADLCASELVQSIYETLQRIISYEYNLLIEQNMIKKRTAMEKNIEFRRLILSDGYGEKFDEKYYIFAHQQKMLLKDRATYWREIFTNYEKYRKAISNYFKQDYGDIIGIRCSEGDMHNGKTVARVKFESGELLFKPRNENNAELMKSVIRFIASGSDIIDYKFIEYFQCEGISWEKIVEPAYCRNKQEMQDYYYRSGVMTACFYFLGSFDMHHENVIACGAYPVIVDCETLARAQFHELIKMDPKDVRVSVLATSFLPYVNDNNPLDINISGLFPEKGVSKIEQAGMDINADGLLQYSKKNIEIEAEKNIVCTKNGDVISFLDARTKIKEGFTAACHFAMQHKADFIELIRDFSIRNEVNLRQILRGTQAYYTFVRASNHPQMLSDEDKRDDLFDILRRNFVAGPFGYLRVQNEIAELKKGNIPLYYTTPNSQDLMGGGRIICSNYFSESPLETIYRRINEFSEDMLEYQLHLIDKSIFVVQSDEFFGYSFMPKYHSEEKMTEDWMEDNIKAYANYLKKSEFLVDVNVGSMECVGFSKGNRIFSMGDINYAIYENGGFPLFLTYYGLKFDDNAAIETGKHYTEFFIRKFQNLQNKFTEKDNLSVFAGFGGVLYVTFNMYVATQDAYYLNNYIEEARFIIDKLYQQDSFTAEDFDYINGSATTVYFICKTLLKMPNKLGELEMSLRNLLKKMTDSAERIVFNSSGFAHGITGVAVELSMFNSLLNKPSTHMLIENLLAYENKLNDSKPSEQMNYFTWCNGKSGLALGRHLISKYAPDCDDKIVNPIDWNCWINEFDWYHCDNMCLCHGTFGNIEIASVITGGDSINDIRELNRPFDRIQDIVWIKDLPYNFENFMAGCGGIAYVMLELLGAAPSILSLDIYECGEIADEKG